MSTKTEAMTDTTQPGADALDSKLTEKNAVLKLDLRADSGYRAVQEDRISAEQWGKICTVVAGTDVVLARRAAQPVEAATWTKERITELAKDIAVSVAKNASTVPQLTFPHIYLGLCEALLAATHPAEPVAPQGGALVANADPFAYAGVWRGNRILTSLDRKTVEDWVNYSAGRSMVELFDHPAAAPTGSAAAPANAINSIIDHIADNWPMKKYSLEEIEIKLREFATNQPIPTGEKA